MPIWILIMALALLTTAMVMAVVLFAVSSLRKGGIMGLVTGSLAVFGGLSLYAYLHPGAIPGLGKLKLKGGPDA